MDTDQTEFEALEGTPNEEQLLHLFTRLRGPREGVRGGDRVALRDYLVTVHSGLVEHCARSMLATGEPLEDLVQEGYVGLIKAVDRFDPAKGVRFTTYAHHLIMGEIRHYLRDLGRIIHEPGWHSELRQRISRTADQLQQKLGRLPTAEEIGEAAQVPAATVQEVQARQQLLGVESLDYPGEDDDAHGVSAQRSLQRHLQAESRVDDRLLVDSMLPRLRELEKQAVQLFYFEEKSKTEIARELGISINYAAYLVKRGVDNLRHLLAESDLPQPMSWPQQEARAAYLLGLLGESATVPAEERRRLEAGAVPPVARVGVLPPTEWAIALDQEVQRSARYGQQFSLCVLRLENGAALASVEGDESLLARLQRVTRRCCRTVDRITRLPGRYEFMVLMPHSGRGADGLGKRWQRAVRGLYPPGVEGSSHEPDCRWKLAIYPANGHTAEDLIRYVREL